MILKFARAPRLLAPALSLVAMPALASTHSAIALHDIPMRETEAADPQVPPILASRERAGEQRPLHAEQHGHARLAAHLRAAARSRALS